MASSSGDPACMPTAGPRCLAPWSFSLAALPGPVRWTSVLGGFSGSAVGRGDDATGTPILALKQWPETTTAARLAQIHDWMNRAVELPFVPRVLRTNDGGSDCVEGGCVWDLTTWMPG